MTGRADGRDRGGGRGRRLGPEDLSGTLILLVIVLAVPSQHAAGAVPAPFVGDRPPLGQEEGTDTQRAVLEVVVNSIPQGEYFLEITPDGDVLFPVDELRDLPIEELERLVDPVEDDTVSLRSLEPYLSYRIDSVRLVLEIEVRPDVLGETVVDMYRRPEGTYREDDSLYLNYGADYALDDRTEGGAGSVTGELGARIAGFLGTTTYTYEHRSGSDRLVRLRSRLIRDFRDSLNRLAVGDFDGFSGPLGSAVPLGGVSFSKNFSLDPYLLTVPTLNLTGSVRTPSDLEIYRNGQLLRRERIPPGEFVLDELSPTLLGDNRFEVLIRDAFGRERSLSRPFYFDQTKLRAGLHRYSYGVGFRRRGLGRESFDYGRPVAMGFHEVGLSRRFDVQFAGELSSQVGNLGAGTSAVLGSPGTVDVNAAVSRRDGKWGGAGALGYSVFGRHVSALMTAQLFTPGFENLGSATLGRTPQFAADLRLRFNLGPLGSLSTTLSHLEARDGEDRTRYSISVNRQLLRRGNLFVAYSRTDERGDAAGLRPLESTDDLLVGLHYYLGGGVSASSTHTVRDGDLRQSLRLQKNPPLHRGIGYRVEVDNDFAASTTEGSGSFQYNGTHGIHGVEVRRTGDTTTGRLRTSGGVVLLGGALNLTRPVTDSFALVRLPDVEGVGVRFNNQPVGRTDEDGELLVPNLLPYHVNKLSLDDGDLPLDLIVDGLERSIVSPFKGGSVVEFDGRTVQGIFGVVLVPDGEGGARRAGYGRLRVHIDGEILRTQTGRGGEFYLENVPPGRYRIEVAVDGEAHACRLSIPRSEEILVDLGEIPCGVDETG